MYRFTIIIWKTRMVISALCSLRTDSFCCYIKTNDLYTDMKEHKDLYDTSNFECTHALYWKQAIVCLVNLRARQGRLLFANSSVLAPKCIRWTCPTTKSNSKIRVKGIKKSYVKKKVRHNQFLNVRTTHKSTGSEFCNIPSLNYVLQTVNINNRCLNVVDDKRYIRDDGLQRWHMGIRIFVVHDWQLSWTCRMK